MTRIAIVGGGITGLVAALTLEKETDAEIDLYEASDRLGGKISTRQVGELTVEGGPDCFFALKPGTMDLVHELGLESELIEPKRREFAMLVHGQIHRVPAGLVSLANVDVEAVRETPFLSEEAKARVSHPEPLGDSDGDESIRGFFTRRYGVEFSRLVAEPLLAGTHGGNAETLSMRALYPVYLRPPAVTPRPTGATFLSFRNGMQTLIDGVAGALKRTRTHLSHPVSSLTELGADRILVALPAPAAANLLEPLSKEGSGLMREIPHRSSAIVSLTYPREAIRDALAYTGFLVPEGEHPDITGATWSSVKWPSRAPEDTVLIRIFMRDRSLDLADDATIEIAHGAISSLLGISSAPEFRNVVRWRNALPQYELGHLERMERLDAAMSQTPDVYLAGTSYRGVGVPDCIRQGREVAHRIANEL